MTKIIKCKIENVLGVENVSFDPKGQSVTIGGPNGSGKTSTLWALVMALGGGKYVPQDPLKLGTDQGQVVLETDEFTVEWKVKPDRKYQLTVRSLGSGGSKVSSPQQLLDKVFGNLSFDPGEFMSMDQSKKVETLANLVKVDISKHETMIEKLYYERRDVGRDLDKIRKVYDSLPGFDKTSEKEVSVLDLTKQLQEAQNHNHTVTENNKLLEGLKKQQLHDKKLIQELQLAVKNRADQIKELENNVLELLETDPILEKINNAEELNKKIAANLKKAEVRKELDELNKKYKTLDKNLEKTRQEFKTILNNAPFPLPGLSILEGNVVYHGVPFEQLSESEKWKISMSIGFGLNPKGIVFMRNTGGLDKNNRKAMKELAKDLGIQLFLEVIDDAEDVQILIEEGKVKENRLLNCLKVL